MEENAPVEEDAPRTFVIPVRRRWKLWVLPTLALLYFLFVVVLASLRLEVTGVPMDYLVLGGAGLFLLVVLVELPFFLRRRPRAEPEAEAESAYAPPPEADPYAPPAFAPPEAAPFAPPPAVADDETLATAEEKQGLRVLEYSAPAKSRNPGAVYAKTYVPVTKEHVLRVETLAAETHEL